MIVRIAHNGLDGAIKQNVDCACVMDEEIRCSHSPKPTTVDCDSCAKRFKCWTEANYVKDVINGLGKSR